MDLEKCPKCGLENDTEWEYCDACQEQEWEKEQQELKREYERGLF